MAWTILNPSSGANITGLPAEATVSSQVDEVIFYDASAGSNRKTTVANIVPDGSLVTAKYGDGSVTAEKLHPSVQLSGFMQAIIFGGE